MTGADPGAHGRRHGAPRRRDHRHELPTPSDRHQDTVSPSSDAEGAAPPSESGDGASHTQQPRDGASQAQQPGDGASQSQHAVVAFFRANPQVLVLLIVCLVLGIGTFLAVVISLVTAGSDQTTGEPSGAILGAHAALAAARWLIV